MRERLSRANLSRVIESLNSKDLENLGISTLEHDGTNLFLTYLIQGCHGYIFPENADLKAGDLVQVFERSKKFGTPDYFVRPFDGGSYLTRPGSVEELTPVYFLNDPDTLRSYRTLSP